MNDRFYDLILVNINFREVNQYLNIARKLASEYRIGVYDIPLSRLPGNLHNSKAKVKTTDKLSLQIMESFGVSILSSDGLWHARLCLVPQSLLHLQTWNLPITFNMACALERFGSGAAGAEEMRGLGIDELWIFDHVLYRAINSGAGYEEERIPVVEMGTPYKRYPALDFSHLKLDYILAAPTTMLLNTPEVRIGLQANLAKMVNSLKGFNRIAAKRHNVRDNLRDNQRESSGLRNIYRWLTEILPPPLTRRLSETAAALGITRAGSHLSNLYTVGLEQRTLASCLDLADLTPYAGLGIEHFLPFVKKGVITGISSCIWHALYSEVPVYNCDMRKSVSGLQNEHIYRAFHVPNCSGELRFDPSCYGMIGYGARKADIMALIRERIT